MPDTKDIAVKRILLAVSSIHDLTPISTAITLAEQLQAQLETLFVEDINLLHLAELPFAQELDSISGELRPVTLSLMEQSLQAEVHRIRNTLVSTSQGKRVQWNLSVVRGNYFSEAMNVSNVDILFMPGSKRVSMAKKKACPTDKPRYKSQPIFVYFNGNQESQRALVLANKMALSMNIELIVLLPEWTDSLVATANTLIGANNRVRFEVSASDIQSINNTVKSSGCSLLMMPRTIVSDQPSTYLVSDSFECPLVLVT